MSPRRRAKQPASARGTGGMAGTGRGTCQSQPLKHFLKFESNCRTFAPDTQQERIHHDRSPTPPPGTPRTPKPRAATHGRAGDGGKTDRRNARRTGQNRNRDAGFGAPVASRTSDGGRRRRCRDPRRPADTEQRERIELRSKASVTAYLTADLSGDRLTGRSRIARRGRSRRRDSCRTLGRAGPDRTPGRCPDRRAQHGRGESGPDSAHDFRQQHRPAAGIDMPRVASGTFASATITTRGPGPWPFSRSRASSRSRRRS